MLSWGVEHVTGSEERHDGRVTVDDTAEQTY